MKQRQNQQLKTSRLEPIGNQALSQTLMANHENLWKALLIFSISDPGVDLLEPTAISKPCQRPKRNSGAQHLHSPLPMILQCLSFLPNWRSCDGHKSHLRGGGRTWYIQIATETAGTGLDILEKKNCTTSHITFLKLLQILPRITISVQSCS